MEGQKGWVEIFHERLLFELEPELGGDVVIWRDKRLQGNDLFPLELVETVSSAALLVCIFSPSYRNSDWCRKELETFCEQAAKNGGLGINNKSRIFKVLKLPVPLEEHPPQIRDMLGYEFYKVDKDTQRTEEFGTDFPPHKDPRYWLRLNELACDIKNQIVAIRSLQSSGAGTTSISAKQQAVPPSQSNSSSPLLKVEEQSPSTLPTPAPGMIASAPAADSSQVTIYLADNITELNDERDRVKSELQQFGYHVLPDKELPQKGPELVEAVRGYLQQACLSVHLIGEYSGPTPSREKRPVDELQIKLAEERSAVAPQFSRLIWLPKGLAAKDEAQAAFIEYLTNSPEALKNADLVGEKLEDLKSIIQAKLTLQATAGPDEHQGLARVYLACDTQDIEAISPLYGYLFAEGFDVLLPPSNEVTIQADQQNLQDCDAVLLFCGNVNQLWMQQRWRAFQKAITKRAKPLTANAIYYAPPEEMAKKAFSPPQTVIIRNFADFSPESLAPFIKQIKEAKGGTR